MRIIVLLAVVGSVGCTKHNPLSCCTTDAQCQMFGLDHVTACSSSSDVCNSEGVCVAPECSTSADCTSSDAPVCVGQLCVAACTGDPDCTGSPVGPYCAPDGSCVACTMDSQCTGADAPVCDMTTNTCRGCQDDGECASGVCIEAQGTCADQSAVLYVATFGSDAGTCTSSSPCVTLGHALSLVTASRDVIQINTSSFSVGSSTIPIGRSVIIDGVGTTIQFTGTTGPVFSLTSPTTNVTLENMTIAGTGSAAAISVGSEVALSLYADAIANGVKVTGGTVAATSVAFTVNSPPAIDCSSGTVTVEQSTFEQSYVNSTNCSLTVRRNKFDEVSDYSVSATGGLIVVEDNLLMDSDSFADLALVEQGAPGSTVRFNTFVNVSGMAGDGTALYCDSTIDVTSNIFAYASMHPHADNPACPTQYSLYDTVALSQYTGGTGNKVADMSTFFVNLSGRDFHLAASSPALMSAETGLPVTDDYEGKPRPNPTGSTPDMGAFEAP